MMSNLYVKLLTEAVKDVKSYTKMAILNSFKNCVYKNKQEELPIINRHYKETEPYISVHEYRLMNRKKVLAVEFVDKQRNIGDILIKEFRKLLELMINHPGTLSESKPIKAKYSHGVLIIPRISNNVLISTMLSRYFEILGIYTMLREQKENLFCICQSDSGNIDCFSFQSLFEIVRQEKMKPIFANIRMLAEQQGVQLKEEDTRELCDHLGVVLNNSVKTHFVVPSQMSTHDKFMLEAKNFITDEFGKKDHL